MDERSLQDVFGPPGPNDAPDDPVLPAAGSGSSGSGDAEESEQALDDSIDEMFATEDPVARREAFKRAMQLCNSQQY